jgi:parallel beta-helix repeat protein
MFHKRSDQKELFLPLSRWMGTLSLAAVAVIVLLAAGVSPVYAANFTVNAGGDGGDANPGDGQCKNNNGNCTFRAAIEEANAHAGPDQITFNLGTQTLTPATTYPDLTDDGTTIRGAGDITLDGSAAGNVSGLSIVGASNCTIQGLTITNWGWNGIHIVGSDVQAATNNQIGTDGNGNNDGQERNVINNNDAYGIAVNGRYNAGASLNVIAGNRIGTNEAGTAEAPNSIAGILLQETTDNRIGTDGSGNGDNNERNLISGNYGDGIVLRDADDTVIAGNYIGVSANGSSALGNASSGIEMFQGSTGNRIGTNSDGISDSSERNIISASGDAGISLHSEFAVTWNNTIAGNYIGTDESGSVALANHWGIFVVGTVAGNIIGTNGDGKGDEAEGNVISGNSGSGIWIDGSSNQIIAGNLIGLNAAGDAALPNESSGITIRGFENRIGTDANGVSDAAERNVISGNGTFLAADAAGTVIAGNYIGTNAAGTAAFGNTYDGIFVARSIGVLIGVGTNGSSAGRNVISGNSESGIDLYEAGHVRIAGNYIGTDATGTAAIPNVKAGVVLQAGAHDNRIGTDGDGRGDTPERNLISGNGSFGGVWIAYSSNNVVAGNFIGTDAAGTGALPNDGPGVDILTFSTFNTIGGEKAAQGNVIAFNKTGGVQISDGEPVSTSNPILSNSIHSNGSLGIDLNFAFTLVDPNDAGDADGGGNLSMNHPEVLAASAAGNTVNVDAQIKDGMPNASFDVQFFASAKCDDSGYGEGQMYLGTSSIVTDAGGDATISDSFVASVPGGWVITATATHDSNTSEFSECVAMEGSSFRLDFTKGSYDWLMLSKRFSTRKA